MSDSLYQINCAEQLATLLCRYGFDLEDWMPQSLVNQWLEKYSDQWIYLSVLEALYQGRYKIVSVEQILKLWSRKGEPKFHFSLEFESMINRTGPKLSLNSIPPVPNEEIPNIEEKEEIPEQIKRHSIEQFIPLINASSFYNRLKSVAEQNIQAEC